VADEIISHISILGLPAAGNFLWSGKLTSPKEPKLGAKTTTDVC
jgi:hypothetical protein